MRGNIAASFRASCDRWSCIAIRAIAFRYDSPPNGRSSLPSILNFLMTPTIEEKVKFIREKCIEANHEIREYFKRCMSCGYGFEFCICKPKKTESYDEREIRLADILLVFGDDANAIGFLVGVEGVTDDYYGNLEKTNEFWNFKDDDLTHQDHKFINYIFEVIIKKK